MGIDCRSAAGRDPEADLDIGEDQLDVGEATLGLLGQHALVEVDTPVVGYPECSHGRRRGFDPDEVFLPGVRSLEFVLQHRSWRVDMWIPPLPERSTVE